MTVLEFIDGGDTTALCLYNVVVCYGQSIRVETWNFVFLPRKSVHSSSDIILKNLDFTTSRHSDDDVSLEKRWLKSFSIKWVRYN